MLAVDCFLVSHGLDGLAVFDYQGNGSIMTPSGISVLSISNRDKSVASVYDNKGEFVLDLNKQDSQNYDFEPSGPVDGSVGGNFSWVFPGMKIEV